MMREIGWKDEEKLKPYNNTKAIVVDISQISVKYEITARFFYSSVVCLSGKHIKRWSIHNEMV
jgi:hypothetical protein